MCEVNKVAPRKNSRLLLPSRRLSRGFVISSSFITDAVLCSDLTGGVQKLRFECSPRKRCERVKCPCEQKTARFRCLRSIRNV